MNISMCQQWLAYVAVYCSCMLLVACENHNPLYLGQTPPGDDPVIFAPGVVSLPSRNEEVITFSPRGDEIYFSVEFYPDPRPSFTLGMKYEKGSWSNPDTATFSKGRRTSEPFMAFAGQRIYYFANEVENQKGILDLCYSNKAAGLWSAPISLSSPPNYPTPYYTLHPCIVADTSIYFSAYSGEIYRSQYKDGGYLQAQKLPSTINGANLLGQECWGDPYVSPGEEYMIFRSNRTGGFGGIDLYITFRQDGTGWSEPKNLGNKINSQWDELGGDITPDGKYMTFGRNGDIYWVSAAFIDNLAEEHETP